MNALCRIHGLGMYVPDEVITNGDLEKIVDTSDEWITTRTGIKRRHKAASGQTTSDLALKACQSLFAEGESGFCVSDVTHILVATITPDSIGPSTACNLAAKLGAANVPAFDFNAACSGFLYGLMIAQGLVAADPEAVVLLVASDIVTSRVNWTDRATCVLFGDGAGAVIVTNVKRPAGNGRFSATLDALELHADGKIGHYLQVGHGGCTAAPYRLGETVREDFFIQMDGREVFRYAVRSMTAVTEHILQENHLEVKDLGLVIPHQANARIIEAVGKKLAIPPEKLFMNVAEYGNTSGVSLLLAMCDARQQGCLKDGEKCLLTSFGAGFTWGAAILAVEQVTLAGK